MLSSAAREAMSEKRFRNLAVRARLDVGVGDTVKEGQTLAIVEAMKMETRVIANSAGKVSAIHTKAGEQVAAGTVLIEIDIEVKPT